MNCKILIMSLIILTSINFKVFGSAHSDIKIQKFTLNNGLEVILNEDKSAPIVTVNMWYKVGAGDEKDKQSGFAHLFEHLMFTGTPNAPESHFSLLQNIGATEVNGTTNHDRTRYFQTVPKGALDYALWLESERMSSLIESIDNKKIRAQEKIVLAEKKQRESNTFHHTMDVIAKHSYPEGHPYFKPVIGSVEDIKKASKSFVEQWFRQYYIPNNAVLTLSGDINLKDAKLKVSRFFSHISPGVPTERLASNIAPIIEMKHVVQNYDKPSHQLLLTWNIPGRESLESEHFILLENILNKPGGSFLHHSLVTKANLASSLSVFHNQKQLGSQFIIAAELTKGTTPQLFEKHFFMSIDKFLRSKPSVELLEKAKYNLAQSFISQTESIDGSTGKAHWLAAGEVYHNNPLYYFSRTTLHNKIGWKDINKSIKDWIKPNAYFKLSYIPTPQYKLGKQPRQKIAPTVSKVKLEPLNVKSFIESKNNFKINLLQRDSTANVVMDFAIEHSFLQEVPGQAGVTAVFLKSIEKHAKAQNLSLTTQIYPDAIHLQIKMRRSEVSKGIEYFNALFENKTIFTKQQVQRSKELTLNRISLEQRDIESIGMRHLSNQLFLNVDNVIPITGSGHTETVLSLSHQDINEYKKEIFSYSKITLSVVGNFNETTLRNIISNNVNKWDMRRPITVKKSKISILDTAPITIIHDSSIKQVLLIATKILAETPNSADKLTNTIIGEGMSSRLNQLIRQKNNWSYGGVSKIKVLEGQQSLFTILAPISTEHTAEALLALKNMLSEGGEKLPVTVPERQAAIKKSKANYVNLLTHNKAIAHMLSRAVIHGNSKIIINYEKTLNDISVEHMNASLNKLKKQHTRWLLIGDSDSISYQLDRQNIKYVKI